MSALIRAIRVQFPPVLWWPWVREALRDGAIVAASVVLFVLAMLAIGLACGLTEL